jgi:hypothetical protein
MPSIYLIQVEESEPQVIEEAQTFFIKNPDAPKESLTENKKRSNSVMFKDHVLKRTSTLDKLITEKMANKEDFDKILNDAEFVLPENIKE